MLDSASTACQMYHQPPEQHLSTRLLPAGPSAQCVELLEDKRLSWRPRAQQQELPHVFGLLECALCAPPEATVLRGQCVEG